MPSAPKESGSAASSRPTGPGGIPTGRAGLRLVPHAEAAAHWQQHGFGDWTIELDGRPVGVAEVHYAHPGVTGISTDEVEVGWEIVEDMRGRGIATDAMRAALADAWARGISYVVAYIRPENTASHRVAAKLGLRPRTQGLTRSGDPMTVYELRAP